jgi:hypothetical protein
MVNKYLETPYRSVRELNFEDLLKITTIKNTYEKVKEDMVKE